MDNTLGVAIMAHQSREEWARHLADQTGAPIVWDEKGSAWDTGKRALTDAASRGTHALVLQDDVILSDGLLDACQALIQYSGLHPVGLFACSGQRVRAALAHDPSPWWLGVGPIWGPAVIVPSVDVPGLVSYGDRKVAQSYDLRIWQWYQARGVDCLYTNPSLVDHRTGHGSLMSKGRDRRAERFGSGIGLDWSQPAPELKGNSLYPMIWLTNGSQRKRVRKYTRAHRELERRGWVDANNPP